jgi:hypothetical protein
MNTDAIRARLFAPLALAGLLFGLSALPLTSAPVLADEVPPAEIGGPSTQEMKGLTLHYQYSTGREYQLAFDSETVTFVQFAETGGKPLAKPSEPGVMHYRARKIRDQLYLVHWINRSPTMGNIHVALVVDLREHVMHCSALMPGGVELFDEAHMKTVDWDARNLHWKHKGA